MQGECDTLPDRLLYDLGPYTDRQACMARLTTMWSWFFEHEPLFLTRETTLFFDDALFGQGSSFGLRSLQMTRAVEHQAFREHVIAKYTKRQAMAGLPNRWNIKRSNDTLNVLVYMKGVGHSTLEYREGNLCASVRSILLPGQSSANASDDHLRRIHRRRPFVIECLSPDDTPFEDEVAAARKAHIIVSMHGAISYVSLFAQVRILSSLFD